MVVGDVCDGDDGVVTVVAVVVVAVAVAEVMRLESGACVLKMHKS